MNAQDTVGIMHTRTHFCRHFLSTVCSVVLFCVSTGAQAEGDKAKYQPAVIYLYPSANDSDSAFLNSAKSGIGRAEREFRTGVVLLRMGAPEEAESTIKKAAEEGDSPIILLGNQYVAPVSKLAERYPNTRFTIVDGQTARPYPNVQSILFKDNEGAFLVGMIAAKMSHTGLVGFIGGMDSPLIRNFATGFTQGVKYGAADVKVDIKMVGTTSDAWSNPNKAKIIAEKQFRDGADIVFAAAGGSSIGALRAADELKKLAIGVDTNQNSLFPGRVLTSLVKRVDVAVYDTLEANYEGTWVAGTKHLGIKEGALDYAVDQNNRGLMNEQLIEEVATAKDNIISGKIVVESYKAK